VGKTFPAALSRPDDRKHPHVRGEHYEQADSAGETRTLGQIARQEDLTKQIADVPDFATLLSGFATDSSGQPVTVYSNILRQAGYGEQLDQLAARGSDFAANTATAASNRIRGIGKVADELEKQYRFEKIPLEFNAIRAKAYKSAADSYGGILGGPGAFSGRSTRVVGDNLRTAATEYTLPASQTKWLPKAVRPPASNSSRFHAKLVLPSLPAKFSLPPHTVGTARAEAVFCGLVLKTNPLPELPNAPTLEALDEQSGIAQSSSCTNGHGIPILPIG
jgi:hypothetical protein